MAENSKIQWTHHTFNPWSGCLKVAPECEHCYAEKDRSVAMRGILWGTEAQGGRRAMSAPSTWNQVKRWNKAAIEARERRRVFCASLADVAEDWPGPITNAKDERLYWPDLSRRDSMVTFREAKEAGELGVIECVTMDDVRDRVLFPLIQGMTWLDWMLLTKRPERLPAILPPGFWKNVWLGTSAGTQASWDRFVPDLVRMKGRAPVLFVSVEPLLERVVPDHELLAELDLVIIGGESGPKSRICQVEWIRELVARCRRAQVCVFVKQLGQVPVFDRGHQEGLTPRFNTPDQIGNDKKWSDPDNWPEDLRIRELPILPGRLYA